MLILVDAHVHIYDCFDLERFFSSAFDNFSLQAKEEGKKNSFTSILCLTESKRENWFSRLRSYAGNQTWNLKTKTNEWTFTPTRESSSMAVKRNMKKLVFLIAGRQIITAEKLEVLAIGTDGIFEDGESLYDTVNAVLESGAIPVIPWGFGKWYGRRGLLLKEFIETMADHNLFLGDNSGRPSFLPYPYHFKMGSEKGIRILPGSDPLPFPTESWRPGSFGFKIRGKIDRTKPAENIKQLLLDPKNYPVPYGKPEKFSRFARNQCKMQILKSMVRKRVDKQ